MSFQCTCVLRQYGQTAEYVRIGSVEKLVVGEAMFSGQFEPRTRTIPGPFSKGIASSQRISLYPVGTVQEAAVDAGFAAAHRQVS